MSDPTVETVSIRVEELHQQNLARMVAIETNLAKLQSDTAEIVDWVRNAKFASKFAARGFSNTGRLLVWLVKVASAVLVFYTLYLVVKGSTDKTASFKLLFP